MKIFTLLCFFIFTQFNVFSQNKEDSWWFTNKNDKKARKIAHSVGMKDTFIQVKNAKMYCWVPKKMDSSKQTLVMIHGMGINGLSQWQTQIKSFSPNYNLIIPDLAGYAKSTFDSADYSPDFQAKSIRELVRKFTTEKVNVMGFSYGGIVTATYHYYFENEVNKLIICDGPVKYFTPRIADSIVKARNIPHFEKLISPSNHYEVKQFFDAIYSGKAPKVGKKIENNMIKHIFQVNGETKRKQMDYLSENSSKYMQIDYHFHSSKIMFLWGDKDGAIPLIVGERLHQEYPEANFVKVKGAKHDAHLEHQKVFDSEVLKHLKSL